MRILILNFQKKPFSQSKLISVSAGKIFDVVVDIRKNSKTYGQYFSKVLSAEKNESLFIPAGFAHGFLTLKPGSEIVYKCTNYYAPHAEGSLKWNDPTIGVEWPLEGRPIINSRDAAAPLFNEFETPFTFGENS